MTIRLVSGSEGWLGRSLVERLLAEPDAEVRGLDLPGAHRPASARWSPHEGDLRRPEDASRFCAGAGGSTLFHCAGVIHPRRVREFYEVNVDGTVSLLRAAARAGVRRAVVVSSNSPFGFNPHPDHLFDERSPYRPYMHYGRSKMLMEREVRAFHERGELETVLVRAPWFYGPRQPERQTLFFRMIRAGRVPIVAGGTARRSMAYLDDLCDGLRLAASTPAAGGRAYWIADARPYRWSEIVGTVADILRTDFGLPVAPTRLHLPGWVADGARLADRALQGLGFYHPKIHVLSETNGDIACSIDRARRELGYAPKTGLREGMRRSVAWCLQNGARL